MTFQFIPEQAKAIEDIPYYDDVTAADGWQGQTTTKSIPVLKGEIAQAVGRLGGTVVAFQKGTFQTGEKIRDGFRVDYHITTPSGQLVPGRIDIAALPVRKILKTYRSNNSYETRREKSLKMALYMLRTAFEGLWFLQQLSPGYAPLMPFMLAENGITISQMWSESPVMKNLLPPGELFEVIDGSYEDK